ncbi:hypothetical protein [Streptomyces albidoflavus]|uniref:hypothetical protein n=1 Tax=Streptomyces albidoflavus TaxID=1886 RepID=UPI0033A0531B
MPFRSAVGGRNGGGDFLTEWVGEAVAEAVLSLLACVLLGCLALIAYLSWSFSPRLTLAGAGPAGGVMPP